MLHLRGRTSDVVVDISTGVPVIVHWGAQLEDSFDPAALDRPLVHGSADVIAPLSLVPEHGSGFPGRPGLLGHRPDGTAWAPRFAAAGHDVHGSRLVVRARDDVAALALTVTLELDHTLVVWAELTNEGTADYLLCALTVTLPVPQRAAELGAFTGRWAREMQPVRTTWLHGSHTIENRPRSDLARAPPARVRRHAGTR